MTGKELREWRERMEWSQAQAAAAFEIDRRAYQEMEAGNHDIDLRTDITAAMFEVARKQATSRSRGHADDVLMDRMEARLALIDNMPKPGRPKKDFYIAALEELLAAADKNRGAMINGANAAGGTLIRQQIGEVLTAIDNAIAARQEKLAEAIADNKREVRGQGLINRASST